MLVLYVIVALVTIGFVVPCLLDVATTPQRFFDLPSKRMWLVVTVAFWAFGAAAWLIAGRREVQARRWWDAEIDGWVARQSTVPAKRARAATAARARFVAPDDNPAFLLELDDRIRGWREGV